MKKKKKKKKKRSKTMTYIGGSFPQRRILSGRVPERDTSRAASVLVRSQTAITRSGCSQIRKTQSFKEEEEKRGKKGVGGGHVVLPASVANRCS